MRLFYKIQKIIKSIWEKEKLLLQTTSISFPSTKWKPKELTFENKNWNGKKVFLSFDFGSDKGKEIKKT